MATVSTDWERGDKEILPKIRPTSGQTWKWILGLGLGVAGLFIVLEVGRVLAGANIHVVLPGKVYRCAQPDKNILTYFVKNHGIRTVINLRGCCPETNWYTREAQAACELGLIQEDLFFSAGRLPSATECRRLIEVLDRAEYPILIHCRRGADRTGLVAAFIMLMKEGVSYSEARRQLSPRYGHLAVGRTAKTASIMEFYEDWLKDQEKTHSPGEFRRYILEEYRGGNCGAKFEEIRYVPNPPRAGQPFSLHVTLRNAGSRPWSFKPLEGAGVHLGFSVLTENLNLLEMGKAGLMDRTVNPGETCEVVVPIKPIPRPGKYLPTMDLDDSQQGAFFQVGSEPVEMRLEVCEENSSPAR